MGELLTNNVKSKYYPLNAIDIQMKPKVYKVPSAVTNSSINHLVDDLVKQPGEPFSHSTSYYLLISQDGCQTTWHQDFSATSVLYFLLTGEKTFFLVAPTEKNCELFDKLTGFIILNVVNFPVGILFEKTKLLTKCLLVI